MGHKPWDISRTWCFSGFAESSHVATWMWNTGCQNEIPRSWLVGGLEHEFYDFPYIGNVIIPTVTHSIIFQRGRYTTNQMKFPILGLTTQDHQATVKQQRFQHCSNGFLSEWYAFSMRKLWETMDFFGVPSSETAMGFSWYMDMHSAFHLENGS